MGIFMVVILLASGLLLYKTIAPASCTDGKLNQDEEGVDCGGVSCTPCITAAARDVTVLWTRFFEVRPGLYDVAALVENSNQEVGARAVPYSFELTDERGLRIMRVKGDAYILPNERFLVFASNLETGIRTPIRMAFEMDDPVWEVIPEQDLPLTIVRRERMFDEDRPRLIVTLANNTFKDINSVDVSVVISDSENNAVGTAVSHIDIVPDSSTADALFIWPRPFARTPVDIEIFVRQNPWKL